MVKLFDYVLFLGCVDSSEDTLKGSMKRGQRVLDRVQQGLTPGDDNQRIP